MIAKSTLFRFLMLALLSWAVQPPTTAVVFANEEDRADVSVPPTVDLIDAFRSSADGFSSDELLVDPERRSEFLRSLFGQGAIDPDLESASLLALLRLRKAGKLTVPTSRRSPPVPDSVFPVAEISARVVTDRHRISSDTMVADPRRRREFIAEAEKIRPGLRPRDLAKAVLSLRKKRQFRPELVLRVADWDRVIETHTLSELQARLRRTEVAEGPGVYLFRSQDAYLYIGEAANLAVRLREHVGGSDRVSLARYLASDSAVEVTVELHIFPNDSPARKTSVRRAYESELIRSRQPRLNVRP